MFGCISGVLPPKHGGADQSGTWRRSRRACRQGRAACARAGEVNRERRFSLGFGAKAETGIGVLDS